MRVVVIGGGFGGVATARHLERDLRGDAGVEITLVSRYLFQMPRWDRRLRIVLERTVAVFFRPDITKVELRVEREQVRGPREMAARKVIAKEGI